MLETLFIKQYFKKCEPSLGKMMNDFLGGTTYEMLQSQQEKLLKEIVLLVVFLTEGVHGSLWYFHGYYKIMLLFWDLGSDLARHGEVG